VEQYSITNFLESLADDEIEKVLIRLIAEGIHGEDLLNKILETIVRVHNDNI